MGIEGIIAELAAKKRTDEDLRRMDLALERMRSQVQDKKRYIQHELEFHQAIVQAAKNVVLQDFMEKMYKVFFESRKRTVEQLKDVYRESYLEHHEIYQHIKTGDAKNAKKAMVANLARVEQRYRQSEGQQNEQGAAQEVLRRRSGQQGHSLS
jgi:GntR family transcriptional repressor for pyruvate dehydrogenase complex